MPLTDKILLNVLKGQHSWPPPIWLMRQAGRYLPEFKKLKQQTDFLTRCLHSDLAVEITLQPLQRFAFDAAILFSDILILPWAMGQELHFVEGKGPRLPPITSQKELELLRPEKIIEKTEPILETIRRLNCILNSTSQTHKPSLASPALIGFAGSPFTVSCYMIEGGSSKDFSIVFQMIYKNTALFNRLIDLLVQTTADYLCRQIEAGAEVIMLFDSWAGILPMSLFQAYVINPTKQIVRQLQKKHFHTPIIGFPRLAGTKLFAYVQQTGLKAIGLDQTADINFLNQYINEEIVFQGNLDPLCLLNNKKIMQDETFKICQTLKNRPHIFNLGHGILPSTPLENVYQLVEYLRALI
ncbi:Uroporphyrinogen decarboxylase [Commensalibacter sp. Nvir]|uniref:uroporphyrinogen decarboxylase n=1 Tax=Commensalibacter sp. Nvir TaxID=3069817 RepID=UPI002D2A7E97|nr:Uroporphyrinogen decarboxylase [Commensalibacter sp. Nvir]